MATKTVILSGRIGRASVAVARDTSNTNAFILSNVGIEQFAFVFSSGATQMDGLTSVAAAGAEIFNGAAQMDGQALVQFTSGVTVRGAAQMDGATAVDMEGSLRSIGAAQMDGLSTPDFVGALGSGALHADGIATATFAGAITGGFHIGAAEMDGSTDAEWAGVASIIMPTTAQMDGAGSMLAVQSGTPLPPHGIILTAGI